jgi:hypothetical protein
MIRVSSPRRTVSHSAGLEATALGHHWFGEEHILLALLAAEADSPEVRGLTELGMTRDRVTTALLAHIEEVGPPTPKEYDGALSYPSFHTAAGRAQGLALGTAATVPLARHYVPAVLWDDSGTVAALLADLCIARDQALAAVGDLAAVIPAAVTANPLVAPAERQALARQHAYIGEDDVLLAVLAGEPDPAAARILEAQGLTPDQAAESIWKAEERSTPPTRRIPGVTAAIPNAACRELLGRTEGLAVTLGDRTPRSTDALIARLWARDGAAVIMLERLNVSATQVVDDLAAAGVTLPAVPLPEPDRRPWGERIFIPIDRAKDVLSLLAEHLGPGRFGFNTHDGRAWVMAHADVDLQALVDEALSRSANQT